MELSDKIEDTIIKFPRCLDSEEIVTLSEVISKKIFTSLDYWIKKSVSLRNTGEEDTLREYKGILYEFRGNIYKEGVFNHFKTKINTTVYLAEYFEFESNSFPDLSDEKTKKLWGKVREVVNNYFLENPNRPERENEVLSNSSKGIKKNE